MSLGCEGTDHERLTAEIRKTGKPVRIIRIQELGGVSAAIKAGIDAAQELVMLVSGIQRQPVSIDRITMAIKCGASDTTSGMASNCVVGYVADSWWTSVRRSCLARRRSFWAASICWPAVRSIRK